MADNTATDYLTELVQDSAEPRPMIEGTQIPMGAPLVKSQIDAIRDMALYAGQQRRRAQRDFSETDFLCGAMVAFFACGNNGEIPAQWIFTPMSGREVFPRIDTFGPKLRRLLTLLATFDANDGGDWYEIGEAVREMDPNWPKGYDALESEMGGEE